MLKSTGKNVFEILTKTPPFFHMDFGKANILSLGTLAINQHGKAWGKFDDVLMLTKYGTCT